MVKTLWQSGTALKSGGVLAGVLSMLFIQLCGKICAALLFVVGFVAFAMIASRVTPMDIVEYFRNRPRLEYEYEEEPVREEPAVRRRADAKVETAARRRAAIDIPVDDPPMPVKESVEPETTLKPKKEGFFNKVARVRRPDEVLTGVSAEEKAAAVEPSPSAVTPPFDVPAPTQVPEQ